MLLSLEIRNIVLVDTLTLEFHRGLNVLTGETGAGKSILLDALGFALGRKTGRELVGATAGQGSVAVTFEPGIQHPVFGLLDELGLSAAPGELVLRRVASPDGPARCFVNDQRTSADVLRQIGELLVEIHGQHDDRGLLNPREHRPLLDAFGDLGTLASTVRADWTLAAAAERSLQEAREQLAKAAEDADFLRHNVAELHEIAPESGEDDKLDTERRLIQAAGRIRDEVARAAQALSAQGAEGQLSEALSWLGHVAENAEGLLDTPIESIDRVMVELAEVQRGIEDALERLSFEPGRLEAVEERLFAIRALARKHQVPSDSLPDLAEQFTKRLEEIELGGERIAGLETEVAEARQRYETQAKKLSKARTKAAVRLDKLVTKELGPLRMENARFCTEISPAQPGPEGHDDVSFTASINPGAPSGPIDRIASGGELSRFLLALKVCLAARASGLTMIFDEIDRGVGGATADAVGRRLAQLADGAQVLVVTHSPQVAARGQHHWLISKTTDGATTRTDVEPLGVKPRVDEIARMLAGEKITPEARSAARALIGNAG